MKRQAQTKQFIDQPVFGGLEVFPGFEMVRMFRFGNGPVEFTGSAQRFTAVCGHKPVAHVVPVVSAVAVPPPGKGRNFPAVFPLNEDAQGFPPAEKAER